MMEAEGDPMNVAAIRHTPKSPMAYAVGVSDLALSVETAIDDIDAIELLIGDPFDWKDMDGVWSWNGNQARQALRKAYTTDRHDIWQIETATVNRRSKYAFILQKGSEIRFFGCHGLTIMSSRDDVSVISQLSEYFNYPYILEEDAPDTPSWVKDTVWYSIFPDRFRPRKGKTGGTHPFGMHEGKIANDQFYGGDLQGVKEAIPYLKELGVSGIYFTPIFKAYSAHKYDTEDYFQIDPAFGTNADLKDLVVACHKEGIKVMLDGVFNHCGWEHPFFQDVYKNGKASPYYNCFYIDGEKPLVTLFHPNGRPAKHDRMPNYRTFAMTPVMPKWNTADPIVRQYLIDVGTYWIKECDIDGWRLDVSNEVSHVFWRKFRDAVKAVKQDFYLIGENWDDANAWLMGDQFDAVMNYEVSYPIWQAFQPKSADSMTLRDFVRRMSRILTLYPKPVAANMFNLLSSHDTMRLMTRFHNDIHRVKAAYFFLFTLAGSPSIYYGDEIGMQGAHDPDSRRCMIWDESLQDRELFAYFQALIRMRTDIPDIRAVDIEWVVAEDDVLVYRKGRTLFAISFSDSTKEVALGETAANIAGSGVLTLAPHATAVLSATKHS
jgi:glycosidase